jgi:hypothetical protein
MGRLKLSQVSEWCFSQPVPRVQILRVLLSRVVTKHLADPNAAGRRTETVCNFLLNLKVDQKRLTKLPAL